MPPPSQATSLHDGASTILELAFSTVTITTTPPRISHSAQSTNHATITAIATSTKNPTTHTTTYGTAPAVLQIMATALATTTIPSTIATPLAKPLLEPPPNIVADWPPALVIFLLSWLVMAWVVTVVLYLASFPEKVAWLDRRIERLREWRWRNQSTLPRSADSILNDIGSPIWEQPSDREGSSTAVTTGLGISLGSFTPRLRRPRSFDEESLKSRGWSFDSSIASTAPLPSIRSFTGLLAEPVGKLENDAGKQRRGRSVDQENGEADGPLALPDFRNEYPEGAHGIAGVLESVQAVVEFIAGRLAKMGRDEVTDGAEAGLLLPVRDNERQPVGALVGGC